MVGTVLQQLAYRMFNWEAPHLVREFKRWLGVLKTDLGYSIVENEKAAFAR